MRFPYRTSSWRRRYPRPTRYPPRRRRPRKKVRPHCTSTGKTRPQRRGDLVIGNLVFLVVDVVFVRLHPLITSGLGDLEMIARRRCLFIAPNSTSSSTSGVSVLRQIRRLACACSKSLMLPASARKFLARSCGVEIVWKAKRLHRLDVVRQVHPLVLGHFWIKSRSVGSRCSLSPAAVGLSAAA